MPIVPEKRQLEDHVHGALAAQFWSQGIENTRSLTGQTCTAPCEPQPLRLSTPSGLSRTQFLVATQAVRVPVFPGFCDEHGGTVVDRVLLQHGGQKWWGALIGRAKLQRAVQQRSAKTLRQNLADPDNYALAATGRLQLSSSTSLKLTAQVDSIQQLQPLMPQGGRIWPQQQQQHQQQHQRAGWSKMRQNSSLSLQLKQQLEGLDLTADLAVNEPSVEGVRRYVTTPLRLAVDLAPSSSSTNRKGSRLRGLLFRVGLHGAVAPVDDAAASAAVSPGEQQQQHALSVHCQGAIAITGSKTVWQAAQKPWQTAADAAKGQQLKRQEQQHQQSKAQQQQHQQRELLAVPMDESLTAAVGNDNNTAGAAADAAIDVPTLTSATVGSSMGSEQQQQQDDDATTASHNSKHEHHRRHHHHRRHKHHSSSSNTTTADSSSPKDTTSSTRSSRAVASKPKSRMQAKKQYLTLRGEQIPLPLCSPAAVQESVQDTTSGIERLRTDLRLWRGRVESGELQQLGQEKKPAGLLSAYKEPGSCWSSFLDGPHLKVTGLIGLLGRVPLQQRALSLPSSSSCSAQQPVHPSISSASLASSTTDGTGGTGGTTAAAAPSRPLTHKARSLLAASATHLDRLLIGSAKKLSTSITQESQLRLFGSAGASMQLGEMRGNFFDYSKLESVLDVGLNAPETSVSSSTHLSSSARAAADGSRGRGNRRTAQQRSGARPGRGLGSILGPAVVDIAAAGAAESGPGTPVLLAQPQEQQPAAGAATTASSTSKHTKHPAFALEDRSVWHALTLSATQQLVGPVRLRGDWRFALDSNQPCPSGIGLLQPSAPWQVVRHVAGIKPALVDSAFGVDVIVPGAGGLVRLVGWFSPGRKEGGLELRLM